MEFIGYVLRRFHPDIFGQKFVYRLGNFLGRHKIERNIEVCGLLYCMHARIGPAAAVNLDIPAYKSIKRTFELARDSIQLPVFLPAEIVRTLIFYGY